MIFPAGALGLVVLVVTSSHLSGLLSPEEAEFLRENPEIRFVSQTDYPPFEFIDDNGERQGMCIELARWLSTELGFQAKFSDMTFDQAQQAVLSGEADVLTSFFYSEARDEKYEFTDPMYQIPARIFVREGSNSISDISDLTGKKVAVQRGDYAIGFLLSEGIDCVLVPADSFSGAVDLLLSGAAEAAIGDQQIVEYYLSTNQLEDLVVALPDTLYVGQDCMAVAEGDSLLCSIINKGIRYAADSGIIAGISAKWRGNPITMYKYGSFRYFTQLLIALAVVLFGAILVLLWNFRLRQVVENKTRSLRESEERLDQALHQANLGSWDFDTRREKKLLVNERFSQILDLPKNEIVLTDRDLIETVHKKDREALLTSIKDHLKNSDRETFESEFRLAARKDSTVWIRLCGGVVERSSDGSPLRATGIVQNITKLKHSEALVKKSVEEWECTFNALHEMIAILDADGNIVRVNTAQARALGLTRDECVGRNLHQLLFPGDSSKTPVFSGIVSRDVPPVTNREVFIKSIGKHCEINTVVIGKPEDGSVRVVHVARDVSERKAAEKKQREMERNAQHAQKLESLGVLAGGIAHDFNNILMAVSGYAELAGAIVTDDGGPLAEYLSQIRKSVKLAGDLSSQMLAYSGRGSFVVETADVNEIIVKMKPLLDVSVSGMLELVFDLTRGLPPVNVDRTQIEQVILNLVTNASEAIGSSSGTVTVSTGVERVTPFSDSGEKQQEGVYVYLRVSDTGEGMSEEIQERLFEPFFTTKFTGRGLGMAVVYGIVEGHHGFISVDSKLGAGTTIKVHIPAATDMKVAAIVAESDEKQHADARAETGVLFVDDEKSILMVGRHALEKAGYVVFSASDGQEALDVFRQERSRISCVVLDLTMPVMDGIECIKELEKIDPAVRVVLSSGYNRTDIEEKLGSEKMSGYLKKPYSLKTLVAEVAKVLAMKTAQDHFEN